MLYSILQNEASPELKQRIDRDRNKTTYQVDYCEKGILRYRYYVIKFLVFFTRSWYVARVTIISGTVTDAPVQH